MKRFACLVLVLAVGCGPTMKGDDGDDQPAIADADGDGISDADEGRATGTDTDGDGIPDFEDDDSDGDGIPDYREAGDTDVATAPVDSDGDGIPDFRDLDSDGNGREDAVDGVEDTDNDGIGDWADLDDDGDYIPDIVELGPNPAQPVDTDGDGIGDFRDTDSDNDTIKDIYETAADFDSDGIPNYRDTDSDDDCIPDRLEARGEPPADSDSDGRMDFVDRDSDNDGVPDSAEDANCNGVVDSGESSPLNPDTDGDGVSDLVETAAGTDPTNPQDNPQANGDYVFVEPYMAPQTPTDDDLDFKTNLQAVDLFVILDRSGSMSTEITTVKNNLASVVSGLRCTGNLQPPNCIPDLWAGAGTVGYSGSGVEAFQTQVRIQSNPNFASVPTTEPSGCCDEPLNFSVFSTVTGSGGAAYNLSGVPTAPTCVGSPAQAAGYATFGYPCFRQGALPVVLLATDESAITESGTYKTPNWATIVKPAMITAKARLVGILGSGYSTATRNDLRTMATDTGAVDAANNNAPLVFDGAGTNSAAAIRTGILTLANGLPLDLNAVTADDPSDAVDAVASFVDHIETLQLGTPQCANGLTDVDTNADSFKDKYVAVRTGTPVCWKVVSKQNVTVPPTDEPQLFKATIIVYGDGVTELDRRNVWFLVPPAPLDGPIQ